MAKWQFVAILLTAFAITCLGISAYLFSHRYQVTASKDFLYVLDTFTGDISTFAVDSEFSSGTKGLHLHKIGQK